MIPRTLITTVLVTSCLFGFSQTDYSFDSPCLNFCEFFYVFSDGTPLAIVTEQCEEGATNTYVCSLSENALLEEHSFQGELTHAISHQEQEFLLVSSSDSTYFVRIYDSSFELQGNLEIEIPLNADISEVLWVGDWVVVCYFFEGSLIIAKFSEFNGQLLESVEFTETQGTLSFLSEITLNSDLTATLGISCDHKFSLNPWSLNDSYELPLPFSEELGDYYNPCLGFLDALREYPDDTIALAVASTASDDEFYYFLFAPDGSHVDTRNFELPEDHYISDYCFDQDGNIYVAMKFTNFFSEPINDDLKILKYSPEGEFLGSQHLNLPSWNQWGHAIIVREDGIWLHGSKTQLNGLGPYASSVIHAPMDFDSSTYEEDLSGLTLINSENFVGVESEIPIISLRLLDLMGKIILESPSATLWPKAMLPQGFYVLSVQSADGVSAFFVRNP